MFKIYLAQYTCTQGAWQKRVNIIPTDSQVMVIGQILEDGYQQLQKHLHTSLISLQYLEAVAGVRFVLSFLAHCHLKKNNIINDAVLGVARDLCMDTRLNIIDPSGRVDTTGPVLYLIKLLVRQFGFPCLMTVSQTHPWVVPDGLKRADNVSRYIHKDEVCLLQIWMFFCRRKSQLIHLYCMNKVTRMLEKLLTLHCTPRKQHNLQPACK